MRRLKGGSVIVIKIEGKHQMKNSKLIMINREGIYHMKKIKCCVWFLLGVRGQKMKIK